MTRIFTGVAGAALGAFLTLAAAGAWAAEADVDYRKGVMAAIGGQVKALALIVQGKVARSADAPVIAAALADSAKVVPHIFAKGSEGGAAKAAIWDKPDDFRKALDAYVAAAGGLGAAAKGGDMKVLAAAFGEFAKTCKGCHAEYRN